MELKKNMNTIFRSGSLLIKGGITLGLFISVLISGLLTSHFLKEEFGSVVNGLCGFPFIIITFGLFIIFLFGGAWTLQDLIKWTE